MTTNASNDCFTPSPAVSPWRHQRRPEKRKIDAARPIALAAAKEQIELELAELRASAQETWEPRERRRVERRVFLRARQAAYDYFGQWRAESDDPIRKRQDEEGKAHTARDMAARMTREEVALALGEPVPQLAKSMQLKQFADPRNEAKVGQGPDYGDDDDDDDDDDDEEEEQGNNDLGDGWEIVKEKRAAATVPPAPPPPAAPVAAADDELELEDNDGAELELEENGGAELELEENDGHSV